MMDSTFTTLDPFFTLQRWRKRGRVEREEGVLREAGLSLLQPHPHPEREGSREMRRFVR